MVAKKQSSPDIILSSFFLNIKFNVDNEKSIKIFNSISKEFENKKIKFLKSHKIKNIPINPFTIKIMKFIDNRELTLSFYAYPSFSGFQKSISELKKLKKETKNTKRSDEISFYIKDLESMKAGTRKNQSEIIIVLNVSPNQNKEHISKDIVSKINNIFKKILSEIKKHEVLKVQGIVEGSYVFDPDYYESILPLPFEFEMEGDLEESLGVPEVQGINIGFDNSKMGLENISMEMMEEFVEMKFSLKFPMVISDDMIGDTYDYMMKIGGLLLSEVEK